MSIILLLNSILSLAKKPFNLRLHLFEELPTSLGQAKRRFWSRVIP